MARQTLLCVVLAAGVLVGPLAETTLGIWSLDLTGGLVTASACVVAGGQ